jgi:hypothetical protein
LAIGSPAHSSSSNQDVRASRDLELWNDARRLAND